jgi:hypothetical protein
LDLERVVDVAAQLSAGSVGGQFKQALRLSRKPEAERFLLSFVPGRFVIYHLHHDLEIRQGIRKIKKQVNIEAKRRVTCGTNMNEKGVVSPTAVYRFRLLQSGAILAC